MIAMLFLFLMGAQAPASAALGDWLGPTKSVVRVYNCGPAVCMKIVKMPPNPPGTTDAHNPDPALRSRPLCGMDIGTGFMPAEEGKLEGGRVYDPTSGKTYKGSMTAEGDKLKLRGYIGVSMFGRSETWTRVPAVTPCQ